MKASIRAVTLLALVLGTFVEITAQQVAIEFEGSVGAVPVMVENCSADSATISFAVEGLSDSLVLVIGLEGTATRDVDYVLSSDTITVGSTTPSQLDLVLISDNTIEAAETIVLRVSDAVTGERLDSITIILLDQLGEEIVADEEIEVCQNEIVEIIPLGSGLPLQWEFGEIEFLGDTFNFPASDAGTVDVSLTYGECLIQDELDVRLTASASIDGGDTMFVCLPDVANLSVTTTGENGVITWHELDSTLSNYTGASTQATTDVTRTYSITYQTASCTIFDTIVVRVDSLPEEMPITVVPEKEDYCPGEIVSLFSRYLGPLDFPDAEYEWIYDAGSPLSAEDLENFVFTTVDTSVFRRTTTNNACTITDTVELIVLNPPVELNITDTTVCPNEPVQLELLTADQLDEFEWMPPEGLSCTECADPIAQTPQTMTYTLMGMLKDCPASASVNINIMPAVPLALAPDTIVCPGDPVTLNIIDPLDFGDFQWEGTNLSCTDCPSPTANPSTSSTYSVVGTSPDGCLAVGNLQVLTFNVANPTVSADPMGDVAQGSTVTLTTDPGGSNYTWTLNGNGIAGDMASTVAVVPGENNVFKVQFDNEQGCMVMGDISIVGLPPSFDIPNAFTPNADDLNDTFRVVINGAINLVEFKIFNRWGQVVFDGTDEQGWDGRFKGDNAPSEVYAYQAVLEFPDGRTETARGEVMLIR